MKNGEKRGSFVRSFVTPGVVEDGVAALDAGDHCPKVLVREGDHAVEDLRVRFTLRQVKLVDPCVRPQGLLTLRNVLLLCECARVSV